MDITVKKLQRGPAVKLFISILDTDASKGAETDAINVDDLAFIQFRFRRYKMTLLSSFATKSMSTNPLIKIKMNVTSNDSSVGTTCTDEFSHHTSIDDPKLFKVFSDAENRVMYTCSLIVSIEAKTFWVDNHASRVSQFNDSRKVAHFDLKALDGSVAVRRLVLKPHSEIFQALLTDDSVKEFEFTNPSITVNTLEHLKAYIYRNILPDEGLPELLLAAANCFMEQLKADCILKLVARSSAENLDDLIEFAIKNNIPELVRAMVLRTSDTVVNRAYEMREKNREMS